MKGPSPICKYVLDVPVNICGVKLHASITCAEVHCRVMYTRRGEAHTCRNPLGKGLCTLCYLCAKATPLLALSYVYSCCIPAVNICCTEVRCMYTKQGGTHLLAQKHTSSECIAEAHSCWNAHEVLLMKYIQCHLFLLGKSIPQRLRYNSVLFSPLHS